MKDIHKRLLRVEDYFLSAISNDTLEDFQRYWSKLYEDVVVAVQAEQLSASVQVLACTIADRIHTLAAQFFDLDAKYRELTTAFTEDIEEALKSERSHSPPEAQASTTEKSTLSPYIAPAYAWLLDNLHCPYPSISMRDSLADKSGSTRKAIDAWFVDVRRRIGWNSLRRTRYAGKKENIIRAATLHFLENKSSCHEAHSFVAIEIAAQELYADKLQHSLLASRFDSVVLDSSAPRKKKDIRTTPTPSSSKATAYPSPDSSTSSLPTTPIVVPSDRVCLPVVTSLKRGRINEEVEEPDIINSRPLKRRCPHSLENNFGLPSPTSSCGMLDFVDTRMSDGSTQECSPARTESHNQTEVSPVITDQQCESTLYEPHAQVASELGAPATQCDPNPSLPGTAPVTALSQTCPSEDQLLQAQGEEEYPASFSKGLSRRRCVSELGSQLPSVLQNRIPRMRTVSDSVLPGIIGNASNWSFDPNIFQIGTSLDALDGSVTCEVEAFDFLAFSDSLSSGMDALDGSSGYMPMSETASIHPLPDFASTRTLVGPPGDFRGALDGFETPGDDFLGLFGFASQAPSLSETGTLPVFSIPPSVPQLGQPLDGDLSANITTDVNSFAWDAPLDVENLFSSLVQQPIFQESRPSSDVSSREEKALEEKARKLKQLAEMKEAQQQIEEARQRLEAEIAILP